MSKHTTNMPTHLLGNCHGIIHGFSAATAAAGAIPLPIADAVPISAAQIGMIISLGKVFGLTIGRSTAEAIAGVGLAVNAGRFVAANCLKIFPFAGSVIGAITASAMTECMGWLIADDFYRVSIGEQPERISKAMCDAAGHYGKINRSKG